MAKLLVIRFSSLGDVAMTIPVICSLAEAYPDLDISILTRKEYASLFFHMPDNVHFIGASLKGAHRGLGGLHRLYYDLLAPEKFDYVADFHSVLRSWVLDLRFLLAGKRVARIRKGRNEKKRLTRARNKRLVPLKTSVERYADTLARLGFELPSPLTFTSIFGEGQKASAELFRPVTPPKQEGEVWIGIAPFARYEGKMYSLQKMHEIVLHLAERPQVKIFLFGAGKEKTKLLEWQMERPNTLFLPTGVVDMEGELALMSHLDLMVSMDSANMHLASLVNTRVLSLWGQTHPYCGFLGYGQQDGDCLQVEGMECRPCSVFGNKECRFKTYACMGELPQEQVLARIEQIIDAK